MFEEAESLDHPYFATKHESEKIVRKECKVPWTVYRPAMLPKIASALDAARSGVNAVHIIDGRVPHAMLLEILTEQAYGTMIRAR